MNDVSAWNECVDNSRAQLEHQALRSPLTITMLLLYMIQYHMYQTLNKCTHLLHVITYSKRFILSHYKSAVLT